MQLLGPGLTAQSRWTQDIPAFQARFPWFGGDLQTLRNRLVRPNSVPDAEERLVVQVSEGVQLSVAVNHPCDGQKGSRALVLVHGLGGDETGDYMIAAVRYFTAQGWSTYRMNMRGAGASRPISPAPYHAGLSEDLIPVLKAVADHARVPVSAMGFSLGGHQILRLIATGKAPDCLASAVTVSAPLDLARTSHRVEAIRNRPYRRYLTRVLKDHLTDFQHPSVSADPMRLTSVMTIDEHIIAPVFGFNGAEDYYAKMSVQPHLDQLDRPTLALHAADDPWIDMHQYRAARWPSGQPAGALVAPSGGHVGFHTKGDTVPWCFHAAQAFLGAFNR